jgi:hypothetical protein
MSAARRFPSRAPDQALTAFEPIDRIGSRRRGTATAAHVGNGAGLHHL